MMIVQMAASDQPCAGYDFAVRLQNVIENFNINTNAWIMSQFIFNTAFYLFL